MLSSAVVLVNAPGGGGGGFLTYASFMKRSQGAVKLGFITPLCNNVVSLMCGILIFSTVFSVQGKQGKTQQEILGTLRFNGKGNSGLTFIWYIDCVSIYMYHLVPPPKDAPFVWEHTRRESSGYPVFPVHHICWPQLVNIHHREASSRSGRFWK